jgi:hypothetical protein
MVGPNNSSTLCEKRLHKNTFDNRAQMAAVKVLVWPGESAQDESAESVTSKLLRYGKEQEAHIGVSVGFNGDISFTLSYLDKQVRALGYALFRKLSTHLSF